MQHDSLLISCARLILFLKLFTTFFLPNIPSLSVSSPFRYSHHILNLSLALGLSLKAKASSAIPSDFSVLLLAKNKNNPFNGCHPPTHTHTLIHSENFAHVLYYSINIYVENMCERDRGGGRERERDRDSVCCKRPVTFYNRTCD